MSVSNFPQSIRQKIGDRSYHYDNVGMSDSRVICFDDMVLKIEKSGEESDNEHRMMDWLAGKLPVPEVLQFTKENDINYLLMSRVPGSMICAKEHMSNVGQLVRLLAEGLQMLWSVDTKECPEHISLEHRLAMAERNIKLGLVDMENVEKDTFGEKGFKNPEALLGWLKENQPEEELVLTHGDFCLPNIFVKEGKISGFIDWGKCGVADKYQDIALCYRSLVHNCEGRYGGRVYDDVKPERLFEELGLEPNWEKIKYYILVDELF